MLSKIVAEWSIKFLTVWIMCVFYWNSFHRHCHCMAVGEKGGEINLFTNLNASRCMLFWAEKECAIDQWISVKDKHCLFAQHTRYPTLLMLRKRRQNEQSGLIVAMISFVFHLKWNEKIKIEKIVNKYAFSLIQNSRNEIRRISKIAETTFVLRNPSQYSTLVHELSLHDLRRK